MGDIYCPYCREETDSSYEYCQHCGRRLPVFQSEDGGGCFIATASYGTPFAKEIDVLREWRDTSLMNNLFGKVFVKFYYTISPPIANLIVKSEKLKKVVRGILDPFVERLKNIQIT